MAERSYPYDSAPSYEAEWRDMARLWLPTGPIRAKLNECYVFADSSGMQVKMMSGQAWVVGQFYENDAQKTIAIAAAHGSLPRIDRIILRNDFVNNLLRQQVLQGTPNSSPAVPALTQSTSIWEIALAQVLVDAGVGTIAAGKVTDERGFVVVGGSPSDAVVDEDVTTATETGLTYGDPGTGGAGPDVSVFVGPSGKLRVDIAARIWNSGATDTSFMSFDLSSRNVLPGDDARAISMRGLERAEFGASFLLTGLNPGPTTVKLVYRVTGNTGSYAQRRVIATPL